MLLFRLPESIEVRTDTSNDDFEVSNSSTRCSVGVISCSNMSKIACDSHDSPSCRLSWRGKEYDLGLYSVASL